MKFIELLKNQKARPARFGSSVHTPQLSSAANPITFHISRSAVPPQDSDMSGSSVFPALTSGIPRFSRAAQGLKNFQNATCYVNAVLQAVVHLPHLASVPKAEWKKRCRCSQNSTCWLCYLGLRVAASRGDEREDQAPSWILKRLHTCFCHAAQQKSTTGPRLTTLMRQVLAQTNLFLQLMSILTGSYSAGALEAPPTEHGRLPRLFCGFH